MRNKHYGYGRGRGRRKPPLPAAIIIILALVAGAAGLVLGGGGNTGEILPTEKQGVYDASSWEEAESTGRSSEDGDDTESSIFDSGSGEENGSAGGWSDTENGATEGASETSARISGSETGTGSSISGSVAGTGSSTTGSEAGTGSSISGSVSMTASELAEARTTEKEYLKITVPGEDEGTITNLRPALSESIVESQPALIPDYEGYDYLVLDADGAVLFAGGAGDSIDPEEYIEEYGEGACGTPCFTEEDGICVDGEYYSALDELGRCGTATALLDRTMTPTGERESIGHIKPTGWVQEKYEGLVNADPPYLYNRSHLIAYALTGQNANRLNLITGTRHMNAETMLPWEEIVMDYLDHSNNHVLYRVTPYFKGEELLARGVELEAYSLEDGGKDVCFHVFVYNVQAGVNIDYATGETRRA